MQSVKPLIQCRSNWSIAQGPQIGKMVIQIKQWTQETGTVDEVLIEEFIKSLTIQ